jgi:xylose isomerase
MATTNLFGDPVFKDGALHQQQRPHPRLCDSKTMRNGPGLRCAKIYVFWGGREGVESDAMKNPVDSISDSARRLIF